MAKYDIYFEGQLIKTYECDTMTFDSEGRVIFKTMCSVVGAVPASYLVLERKAEPKNPVIEKLKGTFNED